MKTAVHAVRMQVGPQPGKGVTECNRGWDQSPVRVIIRNRDDWNEVTCQRCRKKIPNQWKQAEEDTNGT